MVKAPHRFSISGRPSQTRARRSVYPVVDSDDTPGNPFRHWYGDGIPELAVTVAVCLEVRVSVREALEALTFGRGKPANRTSGRDDPPTVGVLPIRPAAVVRAIAERPGDERHVSQQRLVLGLDYLLLARCLGR